MARRRRSRGPRLRSARLWIAVVGIGVVAFLYYKPARTYLHTRQTVAQRTAEVQSLRRQHARLQELVNASAGDAGLAREARRLGLVKPGEQLFIVRGINHWLNAHRGASVGSHG